ncbi:hypothetical protein D3C75_1002220 [compost metagenome]
MAVIQLLVDPRDQAARQRNAKVIGWQLTGTGGLRDFTFDVQDRRGRVLQLLRHIRMQHAHLGQQLTHMARTAARGSLIGGNRGPLHQVVGKQTAQRHQHQADGAVTANKGLDAFVQPFLDHRMVDRVEDDNRIIFHT